jgi:hypothetical protein
MARRNSYFIPALALAVGAWLGVGQVLASGPGNTGSEIDLDATTGVILRQVRESLPPEALRPGPAVTVQQAIATAAAAVPGAG